MPTATDVFRELGLEVKDTNLETVWSQQFELLVGLESMMDVAAREVANLPQEALGSHKLTPDKLHSTTGWVGFTESGFAIKTGALPTDTFDRFNPSAHFLFPFERPEVAVMSAVGELLACNNFNAGEGIHLGVAGVSMSEPGHINVSPFVLQEILRGEKDVALVMQRMSGSLFDQAQSVAAGNRDETHLARTASHLMSQVIDRGIPLGDHQAQLARSPEVVSDTLIRDTPLWFATRPEPPLVAPAQVGQQVIEQFQDFLALPETKYQLPRRAVGRLKNGSKSTGYFGGDQKLDNILTEGDRRVFSDLVWLIVRENVLANKNAEPALAPWAFHDVIEAGAYMAIQAQALGLHQTVEAIRQELELHSGNEWSDWHDMYFRILVAYKLIVQSAVMADNYLKNFDSHGRQLSQVPRKVADQVEVYPSLALDVATAALTSYTQKPAVA